MPSSLTSDPDMSLYVAGHKYRSRNWINTVNYRNVKRDDRPVNTYTDDVQYVSTAYHDGASDTNISNGAQVIIVTPGYKLNGNDVQGGYFNPAFFRSPFISVADSAVNDLTVTLLGKIADQKANLAVAYAEAEKTSAHILHTANRVDKALRALRKGNLLEVTRQLNIPYFKKAKRFSSAALSDKDLHKTWLEYKYGWIPLLMDVKGTAELFAQHVVGRPLRFSVQKKIVIPFNWIETTPYAPYGGGEPSYWQHSLSGSYTARRKIWCEITNPHMAALQQMGLTNPLLVAWELVPYSFVFDWFVSVGDWLKGLSALHGVSLRRTLHSNVNDLQYKYYQPSTTRVVGDHKYFQGQKTHGVKQRSYGRSSFTVSPLSLTPPINDNLGYTKLLTSLTLLRAQRR